MSNEPDHLDLEEVRTRLRRLRAAETVRLSELARVFARRAGTVTDEDDMLNEALARVLEGRRKWPADVPMEAFFAQVMRSIASEHRAKSQREAAVDATAIVDAVDPDRRPEVAVVSTAIRRILADDPVTLALFELELLERTPVEMRTELGLDATSYDTVRRRLKRRLLAAFPDGYPL